MKYKIIFIVFIILISFLNCTRNDKNGVDRSDVLKDEMLKAREFFLIPDSLRSNEQKELFRKFEDIVYVSIFIKNDTFALNISREEWKKRNLPEIYYDILIQDIDNQNTNLKSLHPEESLRVINSFIKSSKEYSEKKNSLN
jgi:hypothetical protein